MTKQDFKNILGDLRYFTLIPSRYKNLLGKGADYWSGVMRKYCNQEKKINCSDFRWYVIEYMDGHKELAYLRVLSNGLFSGKAPAIYRGMIIPHRIDYVTFSHIDRIRLAF